MAIRAHTRPVPKREPPDPGAIRFLGTGAFYKVALANGNHPYGQGNSAHRARWIPSRISVINATDV